MRRDRYINEAVERVMRQLLPEAKCNMKISRFNKIMKSLGFTWYQTDDGVMYTLDKYHCNVEVHYEHSGKKKSDIMNPGALRNVKKALMDCGWFKDPRNREKFPFDEFAVSDSDVEDPDTTEMDIEEANEKYKDVKLTRAFPSDKNNEICIMWVIDDKPGSPTYKDPIYNLCRSPKDRRPMHDMWFSEYEVDDRNNLTYVVHARNGDNDLEMDTYPVKRDGSLDKEGKLSESIRYYGKRTLY